MSNVQWLNNKILGMCVRYVAGLYFVCEKPYSGNANGPYCFAKNDVYALQTRFQKLKEINNLSYHIN